MTPGNGGGEVSFCLKNKGELLRSQMRVRGASRVQTSGVNAGWSPENRPQEKPLE